MLDLSVPMLPRRDACPVPVTSLHTTQLLPPHGTMPLLQASVVMREMVAVVTRGTMNDAEMLARHPDASFLLALAEAPAPAARPATGTAVDADCSSCCSSNDSQV